MPFGCFAVCLLLSGAQRFYTAVVFSAVPDFQAQALAAGFLQRPDEKPEQHLRSVPEQYAESWVPTKFNTDWLSEG